MGHQQRGAPAGRPPERARDLPLLGRVHRGQHVVQDEERRIRHQRARQRHPLALTAREREAALADHRVPTAGQRAQIVRQPGGPGHRLQALRARALVGQSHVVAERAREEEGLLRHVAHRPPKRAEREVEHVVPADPHRAARRLVEAAQQRAQRGLAAARRAHHRHHRPRRHRERHVAQHGPPVAVVGERQPSEFNRSARQEFGRQVLGSLFWRALLHMRGPRNGPRTPPIR